MIKISADEMLNVLAEQLISSVLELNLHMTPPGSLPNQGLLNCLSHFEISFTYFQVNNVSKWISEYMMFHYSNTTQQLEK